MDSGQALLKALHDDPGDEVTWSALADWLEESGEAARAAFLRLHRRLRDLPEGDERSDLEGHAQALLAAGVRPVLSATARCRCEPWVESVPTSETLSKWPRYSVGPSWLASRSVATVRLPTHVSTAPARTCWACTKASSSRRRSSPGRSRRA